MDHGDAIQSFQPAVSDDPRAWADFVSARRLHDFCAAWLTLQCRAIPAATLGAVLVEEEANVFVPAAVWPDDTHDVASLARIAERTLRERRGQIDMDPAGGAWIAYPVEARGQLHSVVAIRLGAASEQGVAGALRTLHWGAGWLETLFLRRGAEHDDKALTRAQTILDAARAVVSGHGATAAAFTLANELATRLDCRQVAIGAVAGGSVRLLALSHTAVLDRRSRLSVQLAQAMEEALDQASTVAHPPLAGREHRIAIAHRDYARDAALGSVMSVVLMRDDRPAGVLTLGRGDAAPFSADLARLCEDAAPVLGSALALQRILDRPLAGRIPGAIGWFVQALTGPRHPTIKLAAILVAAAIALPFLIHTEYRVSGKAVLEGSRQFVITAPFDGFVDTAPRRAGDLVAAGEVLATLDTREIALEALRYERQRDQALLRQRDAIARADRAAAAVQTAAAGEAEAQRAFAAYKLEQARVAAPFSGMIVSGDLSQSLGAPVERGKTLFEIAPLDRYRVNLQVDERDVARIRPGAAGQVLLAGLSSEPLPFTVTAVVPIATAAEGHNTFRVEATLDGADPRLRPGMEGVGKVDAGRSNLWWIWAHSLADWLRLTAWTWLP